MMKISDHVWGVSAAQDRIWALVCGLRPSEAGRRLLLMLQAYIDESKSPKTGTFVLAGYIASAEKWAAFSRCWEKLLPFGTLNKYGKYHFKMQEMAMNSERMERVEVFFKAIEQHVLASISCRLNINELRSAINRLHLHGQEIDWDYVNNPYLFTLRALMDMFHSRKAEFSQFIPSDEDIDFFFDDQLHEKSRILSSWDEYMKNRLDDIRASYGSAPKFGSDDRYLPLQAADLWAWWIRKWHDEGTVLDNIKNRKFYNIDFSFTEDQLVENLQSHLRQSIGPEQIIYDVRFSWK
jgi:Protein of unknown function (DUF3800)